MKIRRTKNAAKSLTVTAERLSDHSRITFSISSDKTIEYLRSLLNHHLPPQTSNQFHLYSFQRGALIHFQPPSFKLDYFPVIFDQSVLLLQMDDQHVDKYNEKTFSVEIKKCKQPLFRSLLPSKSTRNSLKSQISSSSSSSLPTITCLSIVKQFFLQPTRSNSVNINYQTNILSY